MVDPTPVILREVLACLICSHLYFDLRPVERLALVKALAAELERTPSAASLVPVRA